MIVFDIGDVIVLALCCVCLIVLCFLFLVGYAIRFYGWLRERLRK